MKNSGEPRHSLNLSMAVLNSLILWKFIIYFNVLNLGRYLSIKLETNLLSVEIYLANYCTSFIVFEGEISHIADIFSRFALILYHHKPQKNFQGNPKSSLTRTEFDVILPNSCESFFQVGDVVLGFLAFYKYVIYKPFISCPCILQAKIIIL